MGKATFHVRCASRHISGTPAGKERDWRPSTRRLLLQSGRRRRGRRSVKVLLLLTGRTKLLGRRRQGTRPVALDNVAHSRILDRGHRRSVLSSRVVYLRMLMTVVGRSKAVTRGCPRCLRRRRGLSADGGRAGRSCREENKVGLRVGSK